MRLTFPGKFFEVKMDRFLVEGRELDTQQMACVTNKYHNHLVVAGAGTGKTTTICAKIKWLIMHQVFQADEILVLSFTNASAAEMRERILNETRGMNTRGEVSASTFHKLGLEIIKNVAPKTKITQTDLHDFVMKNLATEEQELVEKITQIVATARTNNIDLEKILQRKLKNEDRIILENAARIMKKYESFLRDNSKVDFSDMINLATKYVQDGKYKNPYKFVVVDEYQDISMVRFRLLQALRESMDYDLFCVGDDWQAIYRFAGSDVDLILHFEKYWGETQVSKIETTYRFPQTLANVSGKFVMENYQQITKRIRALEDPKISVTLPSGKVKTKVDFSVNEICADTRLNGLRYAQKILLSLPENATVFFLGRYTRDRNFLEILSGFKKDEEDNIIYSKRPDLKIQFLTAHKSKGLQADYVFIMNLKGGEKGFPSKVGSGKLEKMLNEIGEEKFPHAEERRLFYVALTRAKKKVYLLAPRTKKSEFVLELEDLFYKKMPIINIGLMGD